VAADRAKAAREKMRAYREGLRSRGLRPVQVWLPDVRSPEFRAEARRQSSLVSGTRSDQEALEFIEAVADFEGWRD
jgi:hypothetical protein